MFRFPLYCASVVSHDRDWELFNPKLVDHPLQPHHNFCGFRQGNVFSFSATYGHKLLQRASVMSQR